MSLLRQAVRSAAAFVSRAGRVYQSDLERRRSGTCAASLRSATAVDRHARARARARARCSHSVTAFQQARAEPSSRQPLCPPVPHSLLLPAATGVLSLCCQRLTAALMRRWGSPPPHRAPQPSPVLTPPGRSSKSVTARPHRPAAQLQRAVHTALSRCLHCTAWRHSACSGCGTARTVGRVSAHSTPHRTAQPDTTRRFSSALHSDRFSRLTALCCVVLCCVCRCPAVLAVLAVLAVRRAELVCVRPVDASARSRLRPGLVARSAHFVESRRCAELRRGAAVCLRRLHAVPPRRLPPVVAAAPLVRQSAPAVRSSRRAVRVCERLCGRPRAARHRALSQRRTARQQRRGGGGAACTVHPLAVQSTRSAAQRTLYNDTGGDSAPSRRPTVPLTGCLSRHAYMHVIVCTLSLARGHTGPVARSQRWRCRR